MFHIITVFNQIIAALNALTLNLNLPLTARVIWTITGAMCVYCAVLSFSVLYMTLKDDDDNLYSGHTRWSI